MISTDGGHIDILVIEDNPGDLVLIQDYLDGLNQHYAIMHAKTYGEAAAILNEGNHEFDAILLDLTLPDLSGEELIRKILRQENCAATIVLTGYADMEFSVKSLSMGVMDYLLKDELNTNSLWKSIVFSIERRSASKSLKESEERYRDLFQQNPSPMLVWDTETRAIIDVNQESEEKYGYSKKEFLSMYIDELQQKGFEYYNLGKLNGEVSLEPGKFRRIWRHRKKNGNIFFAEVTGQKRDYLGRPSSLMIVNDITEKIELQERMIENVIRAEESERNRISKELHDNIVQQLVASGMFAQNLIDKIGNEEELRKEINRLYQLIKEIAHETRDLSHNLKSAELEFSTLSDLIHQLTAQLSRDSKIRFRFRDAMDENRITDPDIKTNLYRIIQELCNNMIKHSKADEAVISLEQAGNRVFLTLQENSEGYDIETAEQEGIGLKNVKSRIYRMSGEIEFTKGSDKWFQIHIEVPLNKNSSVA